MEVCLIENAAQVREHVQYRHLLLVVAIQARNHHGVGAYMVEEGRSHRYTCSMASHKAPHT